jgi:translation initiation factor 2B subunit (eIF-2B alpha/beta/delta family)
MHSIMQEVIDRLSSDANSGAAEMFGYSLQSILNIPEKDFSDVRGEDWRTFALGIHRSKPTIAPLFNLANMILLSQETGSASHLRGRLRAVLTAEREASSLIAENATRCVPGGRILTLSHSSTVARALHMISKVMPIKVTVAEASPGGEGRQFARSLTKDGIETEIIYDSMIFARMPAMDAAMVGADSLSPRFVVNKVGTRVVAEAANRCGKPVFVLCSGNKMSPIDLVDPIIRRIDREYGLSELTQVFEPSPIGLFTNIITERGKITPSDLQKELIDFHIARAWYEEGVLKADA